MELFGNLVKPDEKDDQNTGGVAVAEKPVQEQTTEQPVQKPEQPPEIQKQPDTNETTGNGYKISKVDAKNFKCFKELSVTFGSGNKVSLMGKNGAGKSTLIDAIFLALAGTKAFSKDERLKLINKESTENSAVIEVELTNGVEELKITRRLSSSGNVTLKIESSSGRVLDQKDLNTLFNRFSFNPFWFSELPGTDQAKYLGIDTEKYEENYKKLYDARRSTHQERAVYEKQLNAIQLPEDVPDKKIDTTSLREELNTMRKAQNECASLDAERQRLSERNSSIEREISELQMRIEGLRDESEKNSERVKEIASKQIEFNVNENDILTLESKIEVAHIKNEKLAEYSSKIEQRDELEESIKQLTHKWEEFSSLIEQNQTDKENYIKSFNFPFDSMSFENGELLINGHSLKELSDGEKLTIASALITSQSTPHSLNTLFIPRANLLDPSNLQRVESLAETGIQVILEIVGTSDDKTSPNNIIIEEVSQR